MGGVTIFTSERIFIFAGVLKCEIDAEQKRDFLSLPGIEPAISSTLNFAPV
jgi:hypothetical protein